MKRSFHCRHNLLWTSGQFSKTFQSSLQLIVRIYYLIIVRTLGRVLRSHLGSSEAKSS